MATTAIDLLPTPSVTPPPQSHSPSATTPELPVQINTATRKQHTELNRLIIDRIPYALPPKTKSPKTYALGLAAFAQIYLAFEHAFDDLERSQNEPSNQTPIHDTHDQHLKTWLSTLRPPTRKPLAPPQTRPPIPSRTRPLGLQPARRRNNSPHPLPHNRETPRPRRLHLGHVHGNLLRRALDPLPARERRARVLDFTYERWAGAGGEDTARNAGVFVFEF
jgi:hypothetical protein